MTKQGGLNFILIENYLKYMTNNIMNDLRNSKDMTLVEFKISSISKF